MSRARRWFAVVAAGAGLLGLTGFAVSFERVSTAARASFGVLAPAVPLGVDLAILVFSAAGLLLAWLDMPARWVRLVPAGLTGVTIALNVAGEREVFGVVAHAALPGLWVLAVALAEHIVRHRLALDTGTRMDTVRLSRWLLAPLSTAGLWRRMVLWEVRSYPEALVWERHRLLAVAALRDRYGPVWRLRAPRRLRVLHRLGELDPAQVQDQDVTDPEPAEPGVPDPFLPQTRPQPETQKPIVRRTTRRTNGRQSASARRSMEDLRSELAAAIDAGRIDPRPTAEAIRKQLACSPRRARELRDDLARAEQHRPLATVGAAAPTTTTDDTDVHEREGAA